MTASRQTRLKRGRVDPATAAIPHGFAEGFTKFEDKHGRMHVATTYTIEQLEAVMSPADVRRQRKLAKWYIKTGRVFVTINATAAGGGVAIMNMVKVAHLQLLGVKVVWRVLRKDAVAVIVTKRHIHNDMQGMKNPPPIRQYNHFQRGMLIALLYLLPFIGRFGRFPLVFEGVACTGPTLSRVDRTIYERWNARCWRRDRWTLAGATDIVMEDWQPCFYIRKMRGWGLQGILFRLLRLLRGQSLTYNLFLRDHIHTDSVLMNTKGSPAWITWQYLWFTGHLWLVDKIIVHPPLEFIPPYVPDHLIVRMPATSDLLDDHNRPLTQDEQEKALALLNQYLVDAGMAPLSWADADTLAALIARFCPAKGMVQFVKAMARAIEIMLEQGYPIEQCAQAMLLGNGSFDDRDGKPVFEEVIAEWNKLPEHIRLRIRVLRLGHCDVIKNVIMLLAALGVQPSLAEAWENCVFDWKKHGKPVITGIAGGPKWQITTASGRVINPNDTEAFALAIVEFFTNPELRARMSAAAAREAVSEDVPPEAAEEYVPNADLATGPNVINWLWLFREETRNRGYAGNRRMVRQMVKADLELAE